MGAKWGDGWRSSRREVNVWKDSFGPESEANTSPGKTENIQSWIHARHQKQSEPTWIGIVSTTDLYEIPAFLRQFLSPPYLDGHPPHLHHLLQCILLTQPTLHKISTAQFNAQGEGRPSILPNVLQDPSEHVKPRAIGWMEGKLGARRSIVRQRG